MRAGLLSMFLLSLAVTAAVPQTYLHEIIARAKSLEIETPYVPPPGDPLAHHAAGYAKVMCTAVFMTGLAPDFAAENVGYFTAPYEVRTKLGRPVIDRADQAVHVTLPNGVTRTAKYIGSQGCMTLPLDDSAVHFTPIVVKSKLPNADSLPWPMGDVLPNEPPPSEIDAGKLQAAVDAAFHPKAPQYLGLALIASGILALVISIWQYRWTIRYMWGAEFTPIAGMRTGATKEQMQSPVVAVAILLTCIGLFAFFAVLLRQV
jgi:hypothetical protein